MTLLLLLLLLFLFVEGDIEGNLVTEEENVLFTLLSSIIIEDEGFGDFFDDFEVELKFEDVLFKERGGR